RALGLGVCEASAGAPLRRPAGAPAAAPRLGRGAGPRAGRGAGRRGRGSRAARAGGAAVGAGAGRRGGGGAGRPVWRAGAGPGRGTGSWRRPGVWSLPWRISAIADMVVGAMAEAMAGAMARASADGMRTCLSRVAGQAKTSTNIEVKGQSMGQSASGARELTIGEVVARSGVAASALHFYERHGLIRSGRTAGNQRRYARDVLRRIAVIKVAQRTGIPLASIREALSALPDGRTPTAADWKRLSRRWRAELDA